MAQARDFLDECFALNQTVGTLYNRRVAHTKSRIDKMDCGTLKFYYFPDGSKVGVRIRNAKGESIYQPFTK